MLDGRARRSVAQPVVDPRRMEREVLADLRVVHGDAGVLADEILLAVRDVDVPVDHVEHAAARHRGLAVARRCERVAQVLRDVLQRPDVQMRGRIFDGVLQIDVDVDCHSAPSQLE